jgi:hypothetical protein
MVCVGNTVCGHYCGWWAGCIGLALRYEGGVKYRVSGIGRQGEGSGHEGMAGN